VQSESAPSTRVRRRLAGIDAVDRALASAAAVRCLVLRDTPLGERSLALARRAEAKGVPVHRVAPRRFERLRGPDRDAEVLALVGPDPRAGLDAVMAQGGAVWLLTGPAYPGNVGFAIRTAEVSGADGLYVDNDFDHAGRREALRAAMRADRFMPVGWLGADDVLDAARSVGKRVIGVEDVGRQPPWRVELSGSLLLVVGGESDGVPRRVLDRCDFVTRLPMAGFVASYNLQAAVAAIALERLRQIEESP
jgi:23S rRNA (guanosine2251-2'-O)-methyltransferase